MNVLFPSNFIIRIFRKFYVYKKHLLFVIWMALVLVKGYRVLWITDVISGLVDHH